MKGLVSIFDIRPQLLFIEVRSSGCSDLLVSLVKASKQGDQAAFQRTLEALIAEEHAKNHHILTDHLAQFLNNNSPNKGLLNSIPNEQVASLFYELTPRRNLKDLFLPQGVYEECTQLIQEHHRKDLLRSFNLEPRHRILLIGPPGNGKAINVKAIPASKARIAGICVHSG